MTDGEQYTTLLLRHRKLIWRLCRRYAKHDPDRCADLVQEVSIVLWEHYGRLQPGAGQLAEARWVVTYTRQALRNLHRGKGRQGMPVAVWSDSQAGDDPSGRDLVSELTDVLPDEERRLLQMRLDGYSANEISRRMGLSRDAVYQRISRIIKKLKQIYNEQRDD